jgi:hypothetical protein
MKTLFALVTAATLSVSALAADALIPLSFRGKAAIQEIQEGKSTRTLRLQDRTKAPFNYAVGTVLPLVNSDKTEDARSHEEQAAANAYGKVAITSIAVGHYSKLSATDLADLKKFYTQEKIDEANGIVSAISFQFQK